MAEVIWSEKTSAHLKQIFEYIAEDSAIYAERFIRALILATRKLEDFPLCGRVVPEFIGTSLSLREVIYRGYRILYQVKENKVEIIAVLHGREDLGGKVNTDFIL